MASRSRMAMVDDLIGEVRLATRRAKKAQERAALLAKVIRLAGLRPAYVRELRSQAERTSGASTVARSRGGR